MKDERLVIRCGEVLRHKVAAERKRLLEEDGLNSSLSQTATILLNRELSTGKPGNEARSRPRVYWPSPEDAPHSKRSTTIELCCCPAESGDTERNFRLTGLCAPSGLHLVLREHNYVWMPKTDPLCTA